jgi:hypothetical protein
MLIWEMLGVLIVFSRCPSNYDLTFKITDRLKVNNDNVKFNDDFKRHITVERTLRKEHLIFPFQHKV